MAWRTTGNSQYQDRAYSILQSLKIYCQTPSGGYAGLNNVLDGAAGQIDDTPVSKVW